MAVRFVKSTIQKDKIYRKKLIINQRTGGDCKGDGRFDFDGLTLS